MTPVVVASMRIFSQGTPAKRGAVGETKLRLNYRLLPRSSSLLFSAVISLVRYSMSKSTLGVVGLLKTKKMFLCLVYLFLVVFVIPYVGQGLPYSVFYDSKPGRDHRQVMLDNTNRILNAKRNLKHLNCSRECLQQNNEATTRPEFCFVIVSVSRHVENKFLTQVVAALLPQIPLMGSVFTVYNAEGATHNEAMNLSAIVPVVSYMYKGKVSRNTFSKQKNDYVHALEWCHKKRAKFSVILEDDALPRQDFVQRLQLIIDHRMSKNNPNWVFLKLYYPEKWQGWSNDMNIITELILCILSGGFILTLLLHCLQFFVTRTLELDYGIIIRFLLSSGLIAYMLVFLGRPHWIALRGYNYHLSSVVYAPGCCIPAVLYPLTHLTDLIEYLKKVECSKDFPVDLAMDKFADERGLHRLLAIPNLVKHIGFVSSLPGKGWKKPKEFRIN